MICFPCVDCQWLIGPSVEAPIECPHCGSKRIGESIESIGGLPRHPGRTVCGEIEFPWAPAVVYYCVDKQDRELYIGMSTNLAVRLGQHAVRAPWWSEVAKVTWIDFFSVAEARAYEASEIHRLNPRGNVAGRRPEGGYYQPVEAS